MTRSDLPIYRWCRWGSEKNPPYASEVVVVAWVDPLQIELLLPVCDLGEHVHSLPRILERIRKMARISRLTAIMQPDRIVGQ